MKFPTLQLDRLRPWRFAIIALAFFTVVGSIGLSVDYWEQSGNPPSGSTRTAQFYGLLNSSPPENYASVFGIAHNSGTSVPAMNRALEYGADVIEIDVAQVNGRLIAAHDSPQGWRSRVYRGLTMEQSWRVASRAPIIELDLKELSQPYLEKVFAFLDTQAGDQTVMVATRDVNTLMQFRERMPDVLRFLSIGDAAQLDRVTTDPAVTSLINGITVRHTLLTPDLAQQLGDQNLTIVAWTVNDLARVNDLVDMGVNGIATDNLAIIELIRRLGRIAELTGATT